MLLTGAWFFHLSPFTSPAFATQNFEGDDCLRRVAASLRDPFHELDPDTTLPNSPFVTLRGLRDHLREKPFTGKDGKVYQISTKEQRSVEGDDLITTGRLQIEAFEVKARPSLVADATLILRINHGGKITGLDAMSFASDSGVITEILTRIFEASPRGTELTFLSTEHSTNRTLRGYLLEVMGDKTYWSLLEPGEDLTSPNRGSTAEKYLYEAFNKKAVLPPNDGERGPKWLYILRKAGWQAFTVTPSIAKGYSDSFVIQARK